MLFLIFCFALTLAGLAMDVSVPSSVLPGDTFAIVVTVNPPDNNLQKFSFIGDVGYWDHIDLFKGKGSVFACNAIAPKVPGLHQLVWRSVHKGQATEYNISASIEVSCSDGDICNGEERFIDNVCVPASRRLCDDGVECTNDFCDTQTGRCTHSRKSSYSADQCPDCKPLHCVPKCNGRVCGSDGCSGSCGSCTSPSLCVAGSCQFVTVDGTCTVPKDLNNQSNAIDFDGVLTLTGDTSQGVNVIAPSCNSESLASEMVYHIFNSRSTPVGFEARVTGINGDPNSLDTVLEIIEVPSGMNPTDACLNANVNPVWVTSCADDSSPPGGLASRISWSLKAGYHYFVVVDGYSAAQVGPYKLTITLSNTGCTLNCAGKYCGSASCENFNCGVCETGFQCSTSTFRCVPFPCNPDCSHGRQCGDDGCGGSCGVCGNGEACITDTGRCRKVEPCNHFIPLCRSGVNGNFACPNDQFCGSDCECHKLDEPLMDLYIDGAAAEASLSIVEQYVVTPESCALKEQCVDMAGTRRILKFSTNVGNQGTAPFNPPNPPANFPLLYEWGTCHGHWHFSGFADFALLDLQGNLKLSGRKQSYCAEDSYRILNGPEVNCYATTSCDKQGLSIGWIDVYGPDLDCQFLDITGLAAGSYVLRQCTNKLRTFPELSNHNNCVLINVTIPPTK